MSMNVNGTPSANTGAYQQLHKASGARGSAGAYDPNAYLKELNERVDAPVVAGAWNGKSAFGSAQPTVMIHPAYLQKMHSDPETAAYIEEQINIFAEDAAKVKQQWESQGHQITSIGMYIDESGEMSGYMEGWSEGESISEKAEKRSKSAKEMLEKLEEKRKEKQKTEEKAAEKSEEKHNDKQLLLESLKVGGTVAITQPAEETDAQAIEEA